MRYRFIFPVLAALSILPLGQAGETDISALTIGKIIVGPPVTTASLSGKVVMVEFWGTH